LECFAEGLRTRDIAATLRVSDHTVRMHMKNIYAKLEVQGRAEALAVALRRGYVRLGAGLTRRDSSDHALLEKGA